MESSLAPAVLGSLCGAQLVFPASYLRATGTGPRKPALSNRAGRLQALATGRENSS